MADSKISALTDGGAIAAGDQFAVNRASASKRVEPIGLPVLVYRYTVTGSDKTSIDTGVDTADAGSNDWTGGDLLEIFLYSRTDEALNNSQIDLTFNNDTGAHYDLRRVQDPATGTVAGAAAAAAANIFFNTCGASDATNSFGYMRMVIPNFAGTVGYKVGPLDAGTPDATTGNIYWQIFATSFRSTSAISRLKVIPDTSGKKLKIGSQLLIYKRLSS